MNSVETFFTVACSICESIPRSAFLCSLQGKGYIQTKHDEVECFFFSLVDDMNNTEAFIFVVVQPTAGAAALFIYICVCTKSVKEQQ